MKQQIQTNKIEWKEVEIGELLDYEQPGKYIVNGEILKEKTKNSIPVLTANKSFILGYTEEKDGIYDKFPVILFDDFTTDTKFVDFKFKVKSSAMKLLKPKTENINLKFVFLMMKKIQLNFATHKRYYLSVYQYRNILMPFSNGKPDLKEQKRIVKILGDSLNLKDKGEKVENLFDEYLESVFYEMFCNKGFEEKRLVDITQKITDGKHGDCENLEQSGYYFVSAKDIINGKISYENARQIKKEGYLEVNKRVDLELNDILITNSGTIGRIAIAEDKNRISRTTFQKSVAIIKLKKDLLIPLFVRYFLETIKEQLMKTSSGSSQKNLLLRDIRNILIPLPPLPLQQKFAKIVEQVEKMKENIKRTKQNSEELFNSLVSKAFRGEL